MNIKASIAKAAGLLSLLACLVLAPSAFAMNTYNVASGGSIQNTVNGAVIGTAGTCSVSWISIPNAGACVIVAPGTYSGPINTNIAGTVGARLVIVSSTQYGAKVNNSNWTINGSFTDVVGFELTSPSLGNNFGVSILSNNSRVMYNNMHDFSLTGCASYGIIGIGTSSGTIYSNNSVIGNILRRLSSYSGTGTNGANVFHCVTAHAIYDFAASSIIESNLMSAITGPAIEKVNPPGAVSGTQHGVISNNTIFNNGGGININEEANGPFDFNTISNNIIVNNGVDQPDGGECGLDFYHVSGTHNLSTNNLIYGNKPADLCHHQVPCTNSSISGNDGDGTNPPGGGCPNLNPKTDASTNVTFTSFQTDTPTAPAASFNAINYQPKLGSSAIGGGVLSCASAPGLTPCTPTTDFFNTASSTPIVIGAINAASSVTPTFSNYYVTPGGSGSTCTKAAPCSSINTANAAITLGTAGTYTASNGWFTLTNVCAVVHVATGTYTGTITTTKSGSSVNCRVLYVSEDAQYAAKLVNPNWTEKGSFVDVAGFDMTSPGTNGTAISANSGGGTTLNSVRIWYNYMHDFDVAQCGQHGVIFDGAGITNDTQNSLTFDTWVIGNIIRHFGTFSPGPTSCVSSQGLYMNGGRRVIEDNVISGMAAWAIQLISAPGQGGPDIVSNNTLISNGGGIVISENNHEQGPVWDFSLISNNIIVNNGVAGSGNLGRGIVYYHVTGLHNVTTNNLIYGNLPTDLGHHNTACGTSATGSVPAAGTAIDGSDSDATGGCPATNSKTESGTGATFVNFLADLTTAPLVNYNVLNYQPKTTSVAVNAGTTSCVISPGISPCTPTTDFLRNPSTNPRVIGAINSATTTGSQTIAYIQTNFTTSNSASSLTIPFTSIQTLGNTNILAIGWTDTISTISFVSDSAGNTYQLAIGPTRATGRSQSIYYAKNIKPGANTVTVTFNQAVAFPDARVYEYTGLDPNAPFDISAGASGTSTLADSGFVATVVANTLIFGAGDTAAVFTGPGLSYTSRGITNFGDIGEDKIVTVTGTYNGTAVNNSTTEWVMQIAAFTANGFAGRGIVGGSSGGGGGGGGGGGTNQYYIAPPPLGNDGNPGTQAAPFATINHADQVIALGINGTTVHIAPGNYVGPMTLNKAGTATARVVWISDTKWGAKVTNPDTGAPNEAFRVQSPYVDINGFDITSVSSACVSIHQEVPNFMPHDVHLIGNYCHDIELQADNCHNGGAFQTGGAQPVSGSDPFPADNWYIGNVIRHGGNPTSHTGGGPFTNCFLMHGVYTHGGHEIFQDNIISGMAGTGIAIIGESGMNGTVVTNNTIFNNNGGIYVDNCSDNGCANGDFINISNNIIVNNGRTPISPSIPFGGLNYRFTGTHNIANNNMLYGNLPADTALDSFHNNACGTSASGSIPSTGNTSCPNNNAKTDSSGTAATFTNFQNDSNNTPASGYSYLNYQLKTGSNAIAGGTTTCAVVPSGISPCTPVTDFNGIAESNPLPIGAFTASGVAPIPPAVSSVSPNTGVVTGGNTVAVGGSGFVAGLTLRFGINSATNVNVTSATAMTATVPAGSLGAVNVSVTNPNGLNGMLAGGYTYTAVVVPVTVTSITPATGDIAGGTSITIGGTGFLSGATVTVGTAANTVVVVNSNTITAKVAAHAVGSVNVVVTNPNGTTATLTNGYAYITTGGGGCTINCGGTIIVQPISFDFGGSNIGIVGNPKTFTITNTTAANINPINITFGGANTGDFAKLTDTCVGANILPGGQCSFQATFSATAVGLRSAIITISGPGFTTVNIPVQGVGIFVVTGSVVPAPTSLTFGNITVSTPSAPQLVTVTNNTNTSVTVGTVTSGAGSYTLASNLCNAHVLGIGVSCTFQVIFTPASGTLINSNITIPGTGFSTITVPVSGTGITLPLPPANVTAIVN